MSLRRRLAALWLACLLPRAGWAAVVRLPAADLPVAPALESPELVAAPAALPQALSPRLAEQEAFGLQQDVQELYSSLALIHSLQMRPAAEADAGLPERKRDLLKRMDAVAAALSRETLDDFSAASAGLAQAREDRDTAVTAYREVAGAGKAAALPALSRSVAAAQRRVLTAQVRVARLLLSGKSSLRAKALRRNAALWTLGGALRSAAAEKAQWRYLAARESARRMFSRTEQRLSVNRRSWHNARTLLEDAGRDLRNGRPERAAARAQTAARLLEDERLRDLSRRIAARADSSRDAELSQSLADLAATIAHPKISGPGAAGFSDAPTALRSQDHALDSIREEYELILGHIAALEYAAEILQGPALPRAERAGLRKDLAVVRDWAGRGFVQPKQAAERHLNAAAEALAAGDAVLARGSIRLAIADLRSRLEDLRRIHAGVARSSRTIPGQPSETKER